jgi:hypothetical protein
MLVNRCVEEILRRMNRLDESKSINISKENKNICYLVLQQASSYENNQLQMDPTDPYVNFQQTNSDAGLETSCVFTNGRKNSTSTVNDHSNRSGVVYRQS